jgi:hypothetical protein
MSPPTATAQCIPATSSGFGFGCSTMNNHQLGGCVFLEPLQYIRPLPLGAVSGPGGNTASGRSASHCPVVLICHLVDEVVQFALRLQCGVWGVWVTYRGRVCIV